MVLTETWLSGDVDLGVFNIPGYVIYRKDRSGSRGGGIVAYVRSSTLCEVLNFDFRISDSALNFYSLKLK